MIKFNLKVLMSERNLTALKLSNETGISRITISNILNNKGQGIHLETINTLCNYLRVTPAELFIYQDIEIKNINTTVFDFQEKEIETYMNGKYIKAENVYDFNFFCSLNFFSTCNHITTDENIDCLIGFNLLKDKKINIYITFAPVVTTYNGKDEEFLSKDFIKKILTVNHLILDEINKIFYDEIIKVIINLDDADKIKDFEILEKKIVWTLNRIQWRPAKHEVRG